jgi:AcrR family transcriptional regulator
MQRSPRTATRERILDAALEVFARKGYHRAIVDDIVRASRTSKGAVYHHFPNKEAIVLALVDDFAARLAGSVAAAIAEQRGALAKVECALRAALATFADDERLARLILLEPVSLGPAYQAKRAAVTDRLVALIQSHLDEAVADGSIPPLDTRVATLAWLGAVNEIVVQWLHGKLEMSATIPALTRVLLRSIGARERSH